ncbi:hypothetical protein NBRC111894_1320 [Sporolactobacillus inulinus]|uniref:Uncharacterized protein n=1 Tax=Sporolactobacillus inulinus TaxID=2078 RepID=A0A4Y1Z9S2_9BACL|nr:hypothetical protein NBRC111894_1320 [Sporolactobacillus inulinus]
MNRNTGIEERLLSFCERSDCSLAAGAPRASALILGLDIGLLV